MKRLLAYLFLVLGLVLLNYNGYLTAGIRIIDVQSSLPECKGNNKNISKYSRKYIKKARKWTNCHGTMILHRDGTKYVGEFKDFKYHGQGTYTSPEVGKYVGGWKDNKRHGQGTHTLAGEKYVGEWKDHKRHGQGTHTLADGTKYVGGWKDDEMHGQGTFTLADGTKYVGESKDGEIHGQGTITFASGVLAGTKYVGGWKKGKWHGQGTLTKADGTIDNGIWENDKLVESNNIGIQVAKKEPTQIQQVGSKEDSLYVFIAKNRKDDLVEIKRKSYNFLDAKDAALKGCRLYFEPYGKTMQDACYIANSFVEKKEEKKKVAQKPKEGFKPKKKDIDNDPPRIEIAEAITVVSQSYTIKGTVRDKSKPIYLEINGRPVEVKKGKFELERFNIDPDVVEELKIVAIDQWNNRSEKIVKVTVELQSTEVVRIYEELRPNRVKVKTDKDKIAIIIGIEKYVNLVNLDAPFANRDAKAFKEYATRALGVKPSNIKILVDDKAGRPQILEAFKLWLPRIAADGGKDIYIFFSGHGLASDDGNDLYILPQNGNSLLLEDTAITRVKLISLIQKVNPNSVTMFFDTCYSGQTREERMLVASLKPIRIVADEQDTPNNFTIFSASNFDQTSGTIQEAKQGMFSYYLMKGLEGKADGNQDKQITNGELIAYLKTNVSKEAFSQAREQDPMLSGDPNQVLIRYQ